MTRASAPAADPDVPRGSGLIGRAHTWLGRLAIGLKVRLNPKVTLGVRLIALNDRDEILLVRHSYLPGHALPGGGVEPGESARVAVMREAEEEAGLRFAGDPEQVHVYFNRRLANRDHVILFLARDVSQTQEPKPNAEILSARFYPLSALPEDTTPATRARIAEVLHGAERSEIW